jgi:hypothetical protein
MQASQMKLPRASQRPSSFLLHIPISEKQLKL